MQIRSKKRKAVDNPLPDVRVVPDLNLVYNPYPFVDCSSIKDYLTTDGIFVENPLVYQPSGEIPVTHCFLPVVNSSTYHLPAVERTLLDLPHHIIIDILIRLPAECVFRCQRASKLIEILTTTPFFVRAHLARQATSVIALQSFSQSSDRELKFCFIDEHAKIKKAKLKLDLCYTERDHPLMLYDSYDGLLLFKNKDGSSIWRSIFVIWNPITKEQVTITMDGCDFQVCGFYFNPHNKEYEVLLVYLPLGRSGSGRYAFDILSFGSRRHIGRHSYIPRSERPPTIINGILYWMVHTIYSDFHDPGFTCSNSILAYEIRTNKFSTMRHGGASCDDPGRNNKHADMQLIEMEGKLGLCLVSSNIYLPKAEFVLWVLNSGTNSWDKTHTVTLPQHSKPNYFSCDPNSFDVEVVKMKDGKLLVRHIDVLLLLDFDLNTYKIVRKKGFEGDNFRPVVHTHSLVSLGARKLIRLHS